MSDSMQPVRSAREAGLRRTMTRSVEALNAAQGGLDKASALSCVRRALSYVLHNFARNIVVGACGVPNVKIRR